LPIGLPTSPAELLNRVGGALVTGTWGIVGLRFVTADAISVKGFVAALAFAIAGIGLGVVVMSFAAGRARRRGRMAPAPGAENLATSFLLLGLVHVGIGLEPAFQPTPSTWTWLALLSSAGGGMMIGFVLHFGGRMPSREMPVDRPGQHPPSCL
jgi:hypothetical protein